MNSLSMTGHKLSHFWRFLLFFFFFFLTNWRVATFVPCYMQLVVAINFYTSVAWSKKFSSKKISEIIGDKAEDTVNLICKHLNILHFPTQRKQVHSPVIAYRRTASLGELNTLAVNDNLVSLRYQVSLGLRLETE